jgi:diguanylate cyclase (GGDEF)-like protein
VRVERRKVYLLLGVALAILAAVAVVARLRLTEIDAAIASRKAADDAIAGLGRLRMLLQPPAATSEGGTREGGESAIGGPASRGLRRELDGLEAGLARLRSLVPAAAPREGAPGANASPATPPPTTSDALRAEVERLGLLLAAEPRQEERLERLRWLIRKKVDAAPAEAEKLAGEISSLVDRMEADENARHAGVHAAARTSELVRVAFGTLLGLATLLAAFLVASLVKWEVARRRWTRRRVVKLIAHQRELVERLDGLARVDSLTGLPNRQGLLEALERKIRWAHNRAGRLAVIVADVNRLKHVNAMFGFEGGDEALKRLAERLRAAAGEGDVVARLGGGEFAVVHGCGPAQTDAPAAADRIQRALSGEVRIGSQEIVVTSNAGFATFPSHGADARTLLGNAELALTQARAAGRNVVQPFDEALSERISELFGLERRLCTALKNGEYVVHYQPYCGLETGEVQGAEALLKWRRGAGGMLSASKFVPVLEETGMILDVGKWVLETSCGQVREWEARMKGVPISVNLSVVQFRDRRLAGTVADAIGVFGLDPRHLTLEVTESTCLRDMDFAIRTLKALKDMGVSISIDDFGTGYSSLAYLKRLPVDTVKIDISFVRDVAKDQDSASIISAITTLARSLKLRTIAEGVENEDQRKVLHLLRCDMGQGYLFSPALPANELDALLAREAAPPAASA